MCVCVAIPFIPDDRLVAPAGVTQEEGSFCGACLNFIARRIQTSLSLVGSEVKFRIPTNSSFSTCGHDF